MKVVEAIQLPAPHDIAVPCADDSMATPTQAGGGDVGAASPSTPWTSPDRGTPHKRVTHPIDLCVKLLFDSTGTAQVSSVTVEEALVLCNGSQPAASPQVPKVSLEAFAGMTLSPIPLGLPPAPPQEAAVIATAAGTTSDSERMTTTEAEPLLIDGDHTAIEAATVTEDTATADGEAEAVAPLIAAVNPSASCNCVGRLDGRSGT